MKIDKEIFNWRSFSRKKDRSSRKIYTEHKLILVAEKFLYRIHTKKCSKVQDLGQFGPGEYEKNEVVLTPEDGKGSFASSTIDTNSYAYTQGGKVFKEAVDLAHKIYDSI